MVPWHEGPCWSGFYLATPPRGACRLSLAATFARADGSGVTDASARLSCYPGIGQVGGFSLHAARTSEPSWRRRITRAARALLGERLSDGIAARIGTLRRRLDQRHLHVLIDTTNGCNYRCHFCPRETKDLVVMSTSVFDSILARVHRHASSVQLSCAWEYSIAGNAHEIVATLGRYHIPHTTIYTNGARLPVSLATALIDARLNDLVFSIGEARKETYEKLRVGGSFERVLSNIRTLRDLRRSSGAQLPRLCANLTLTTSNLAELPDFVDLAHEIGLEEIRGRHLILQNSRDLDDEVIHDHEEANRLLQQARQSALELGLEFNVPGYSEHQPAKDCRAAWSQLYISSNGDVSVCPRIHRHAPIGTFCDQTLREILEGAPLAELRRQFTEAVFANPVCEICLANREHEVPIDQGF